MKRFRKLVGVLLFCVMMLTSTVLYAADKKPYLALGADLTPEQQASVLQMLEVDPAKLGDYDVTYITNADEHKYLDSYVDPNAIGSHSLSSVVVYQKDPGSGLDITTKNISFCTEGMYQNACATAGITDAKIIVAGPSNISGTAALVGIFKAYENMTGKTIDVDTIDGALNELIVTGNLEGALSDLDPSTIEQLLAYLKNYMKENNLHDEASISAAVDDACKTYGVILSDSERSQVIGLLLKLDQLDLDPKALTQMVEGYQKVTSAGNKVTEFFRSVGDSISNFFQGLFGKK